MEKRKPTAALAVSILIFTGAPGVAQIPEGFEVAQVTFDPEFWDSGVSINNCGEIVFHKRMGMPVETTEIFLYDNGRLTRLTDDNYHDAFPDNNDLGTIVWGRAVDGETQLVRYVNGESTIMGSSAGGPQINNLSHIVAYEANDGNCGAGATVYHYHDDVFEVITDNDFSNQSVQNNDSDWITWTQFDFCVDPWESEVMLFIGGDTIQLTQGQITPRSPHINNLGEVVWGSRTETGGSLLTLWKDGVSTMITDWGLAPRINDLSEIAFHRWHEDNSTWQVWLYRGAEILQITDEPFWNSSMDINNWTEIPWVAGNFPNSDLMLMRRIRTGEADFDGHIDLKDAAAFQNCMTGPGDFDGTTGGFDRLCDCRFLDIDHDRDVDRDDYALFAAAMTGPQ
ncbi:MAG: hypothetical protein IID36_12540 [Planctomycetes bacterium]|nr:hypothetical protein [Planctomycetota bacterium]